MYCTEGSDSTHMWERVQQYVAGTSPSAALQGGSLGFPRQLPSSVLGFWSSVHCRLCCNVLRGYQALVGRAFCSGTHHPSGRTHSLHTAEQTPESDAFKILICQFNIWLLKGSWTNLALLFFNTVFVILCIFWVDNYPVCTVYCRIQEYLLWLFFLVSQGVWLLAQISWHCF